MEGLTRGVLGVSLALRVVGRGVSGVVWRHWSGVTLLELGR
jgi:hypothetical protein